MPYDPEGLLGTLNSIFMCYLGLQASAYSENGKRNFLFSSVWTIIRVCKIRSISVVNIGHIENTDALLLA